MYHALSEYLIARRRRSDESCFLWFLVVVAGFFSYAVRMPWKVVPIAILGMLLLALYLGERQRQEKVQQEREQTKGWLDTLTRFAESGSLENRSHPELIDELEACARLRREALHGLESPHWSKLVSNTDWKRIEQLCRQAADDLLVEALWAAKPLIRPHGGRKTAFDKLCATPGYADRPLAAVRSARASLDRLVHDINEFASGSLRVDALEQAQRELDSIRLAVQELER